MSDADSDAMARKRRSEDRLGRLGLAVDESLPPFPHEVALRSPTEAARRATALWVVGAHGESMPTARAVEILDQEGCVDAISVREARFLRDESPDPDTAAFFARRYEGLWVLLWHLGYLDDADRFDVPCDIGRMLRVMVSRTAEELAEELGPRPLDEVMDLADLAWRCHHALATRPLPGIDRRLVAQRLKALRWLLGIGGEWDEVQPDD